MTAADSDDGPTYDGISREQVVRYLKAHPDFLDSAPELLTVLTPPSYNSGVNVVDIQRFMVDKLRDQIGEQQGQLRELLFSCRDNLSAQHQVHQAVMHLLECESREALLTVIRDELPEIFAVDVVRVCLEIDIAPTGKEEFDALTYLPAGTLAPLLPGDAEARLGSEPPLPEEIFGQASDLVESYALARFSLSTPPGQGVIAFGVRKAEQFSPQQGTELLRFLARIVGLCLDRLET